MSLKFKRLENRVSELERQSYRMFRALKQFEKKTGIKITESKELLSIPPADPDLRQTFEKKL